MKTIQMSKLIFALSFFAILSCSKTEENTPLTPPTAEITVDEMVREASLRNQIISFKVLNENGDDVTAMTTFYVDGVEIIGNTFSSPIIGDFQVYGVYTENGVIVTTTVAPFKVIIPKRKVVLEDYTGTWCGFCPSVAAAIEDALEFTSDLAVVAIHETANSNPDPMHFEDVQLLQDEFGVTGLPAARINRTTIWHTPYSTNDIAGMVGVNTDLAISLVSEINEGVLTVKVNVVYEEGSVVGDKLVVYLVESGVIHSQTNYYNQDPTSPYYQLGNPIPEFVHNEALRLSLSQIFGDNIPGTAALEEYSKTYSATLSTDYNSANLSLVVMVVSEDNTARNAQFADVNEEKAYE